ncbi:MAG: hypothetical protein IJ021_00335 [Clostridia bacterium]|nr:hypothetical protein [Clostridia bacterium]
MRKTSVFSRIYAGIGIFLLLLVVAVGILISIPSDTVDFRGTVDSIMFDDEENCAYITATGIFGGTMEIYESDGSSISDMFGEKYSLRAIKPGDEIDLDYKEYHGEKSALVSAKWIKVLPKETLPAETEPPAGETE